MKYANIVFIQGSDETEEPEQIFRNEGIDALCKYLKQWDYGAESENDVFTCEPWGTIDTVYTFGNYVVFINMSIPYFGLARILKED